LKKLSNHFGEISENLVDQGKFYASKSFYDPINDQQVIVGWIAEDDDQGVKRDHSLPRSIFLSDDGLQIRSKPIEEVQTLRNQSTHQVLHDIVLPSLIPFQLIPTINGNQIELIINWQFPKHQAKIF
jgi:beta-fructofuranosidase